MPVRSKPQAGYTAARCQPSATGINQKGSKSGPWIILFWWAGSGPRLGRPDGRVWCWPVLSRNNFATLAVLVQWKRSHGAKGTRFRTFKLDASALSGFYCECAVLPSNMSNNWKSTNIAWRCEVPSCQYAMVELLKPCCTGIWRTLQDIPLKNSNSGLLLCLCWTTQQRRLELWFESMTRHVRGVCFCPPVHQNCCPVFFSPRFSFFNERQSRYTSARSLCPLHVLFTASLEVGVIVMGAASWIIKHIFSTIVCDLAKWMWMRAFPSYL